MAKNVLEGRENCPYPAPSDSSKTKSGVSEAFKQANSYSSKNVLSGAGDAADSGARSSDDGLGANNWIKPDKGNDFAAPNSPSRKSTSYGS